MTVGVVSHTRHTSFYIADYLRFAGLPIEAAFLGVTCVYLNEMDFMEALLCAFCLFHRTPYTLELTRLPAFLQKSMNRMRPETHVFVLIPRVIAAILRL